MTLDVLAAILLVILSYLGWRTGALGQILRLVAAAVVLLFGRVAAGFVRDLLFGASGFAEPMVEVCSYFLGATLLYAAVVGSGWFVIKTMRAASCDAVMTCHPAGPSGDPTTDLARSPAPARRWS